MRHDADCSHTLGTPFAAHSLNAPRERPPLDTSKTSDGGELVVDHRLRVTSFCFWRHSCLASLMLTHALHLGCRVPASGRRLPAHVARMGAVPPPWYQALCSACSALGQCGRRDARRGFRIAIEARHMPANPPFRAEHIGSLLRPAGLADRRRQWSRGEIDGAALAAAEDEAIEQAIRLQEDVGLRLATDGEFRRRSYHSYFYG